MTSTKSTFQAKKPPAGFKAATEVNALLRSEIAHLWPNIANITALQKACTAALPHIFPYCQVLQLEGGKLTLSTSNAALATKLKQQLPKLQLALQKAGWQVEDIRIKVLLKQSMSVATPQKQCEFSPSALHAFEKLETNLAKHNRETGLLDALRTLIARHK